MAIRRFEYTEDLSYMIQAGYTILTPTNRISTAILDSLAEEATSKTWLKRNVIPIDLWIKKKWRDLAHQGISPCCDYEILEGFEEQTLWSLCIEGASENHPLINPQETAFLVSRAHQELNSFSSPTELKNIIASRKNRNFTFFLKWHEDFLQRTEAIKALPLSTALLKLIKLLEKTPEHITENIALVNFYDPPPSYRALFSCLQVTNTVENYVSSIPPLSKVTPEKYATTNSLRIEEFNSDKDEIYECVRWTQEIIKENPNAHIGIITPNPQGVAPDLQREFLRRLRRESIPAFDANINTNSYTGAFKSDGIVYTILFTLRILENDILETENLCQFLRSPFLIGSTEECEPRSNLELYLRKKRSNLCSISAQIAFLSNETGDFFCPKLVDALVASKNIIRQNQHSKTPFELSHVFRKLLALLFPEISTSSQYAVGQLEAFTKSTQKLARLTPIIKTLSYKQALNRLWLLCADETKKKPYDKTCQISIYTPSDALGLNYTHAWFLSFNDVSYPEQIKKNPFLPVTFTEKYLNPEILLKKSEQTVRNIFDAISDTIKLSYAIHEDELEQNPSQLFGYLQASRTLTNKEKATSSEIEIIDDSAFLKLKESEIVNGGSQLITDQAQCPFQAFAKHRLNVSALQSFTPGISPMDRGTALHIGLDHLFKKITSQKDIELIPNLKIKKIISDAISMSIKYLRRQYPLVITPNFEITERERLDVLFQEFLSKEQERHIFKVIQSEQEYFIRIADLDLRLRIDRVDEIENNEIVLIDYKSGSTTPSLRPESWALGRSDNLQLPLYFFAYQAASKNKVTGLVFAQLNAEELKYNSLLRSDNYSNNSKRISDEQWCELQKIWETNIYSLAKEFKEGVVNVDPLAKATVCNHCKLNTLCRIKEQEQLFPSTYVSEHND